MTTTFETLVAQVSTLLPADHYVLQWTTEAANYNGELLSSLELPIIMLRNMIDQLQPHAATLRLSLRAPSRKSPDQCKQDGNMHFRQHRFQDAIDAYSEGLCNLVVDCDEAARCQSILSVIYRLILQRQHHICSLYRHLSHSIAIIKIIFGHH
jgi:hypothetical protein